MQHIIENWYMDEDVWVGAPGRILVYDPKDSTASTDSRLRHVCKDRGLEGKNPRSDCLWIKINDDECWSCKEPIPAFVKLVLRLKPL